MRIRMLIRMRISMRMRMTDADADADVDVDADADVDAIEARSVRRRADPVLSGDAPPAATRDPALRRAAQPAQRVASRSTAHARHLRRAPCAPGTTAGA
jgi:hypothetical protein